MDFFYFLGAISVAVLYTFVIFKASKWGFNFSFENNSSIFYVPLFKVCLMLWTSLGQFLHSEQTSRLWLFSVFSKQLLSGNPNKYVGFIKVCFHRTLITSSSKKVHLKLIKFSLNNGTHAISVKVCLGWYRKCMIIFILKVRRYFEVPDKFEIINKEVGILWQRWKTIFNSTLLYNKNI